MLWSSENLLYREPRKGLQILLSRTKAGPGRKVKQEQEYISPNHVQAFSGAFVHTGRRECPESARRWPSLLNTEAMESERVSVLALQEFIYFSHVALVVVVVGAQHLLARSPLAPLSAARTFCAIAT